MQLKSKNRVQTGDLQSSLGLSPKQERELLSRLSRKGLIVRVKRGIYLVPTKVPPGGKWMPNEYILIAELMKTLKAKYLVSGPAAFQYYGLTSQIPNVISVYNNKISGIKNLGNMKVQLIRVTPKRLGDWTTLKLPNRKSVRISTLARTILDALYDWSRFNTIPRAYDWIRKYKNDGKFSNELVSAALTYGNVSTQRRLGYIFEQIGIDSRLVKKLRKIIPTSKGWIPLVPNLPVRGKINRDWGLVING